MQHENGLDKNAYTFKRRPFKALFWEIHDSPIEGILREKQLKKWTRAKKRALIYDDRDELRKLAASKNDPETD
jgi:putative endonuclease